VTVDRLGWADKSTLVTFYESHRDRPDDLYPSERRFLPWLARQSRSVLDVGCALGGFVNIWRSFQPDISYAGVDVSALLMERARQLRPDVEFLQGDCAEGLALPDQSFEVVQALGWLHWEPRYPAALQELWRLTGRWLFFDVRLIEGEDEASGVQHLEVDELNGGSDTPYICSPWSSFAELLGELAPATIVGYGYWGPPADSVSGIDRQVCFTTFVLERAQPGDPPREIEVALDAPLSWPAAWADGVTRLPADWIESNVDSQA
jgi:SAM-dependent methyltransferase